MGPRAGLHILENRRSIASARIRTLNRQARSLVPIPTELSCLHFLIYTITESLVSVCYLTTLVEERRLRVFENRVLRRIFGPRKDEVTGEWRKLHNEELNNLYCSPNIVRVIKSRRISWAGHVAHMGVRRGVYRFLMG